LNYPEAELAKAVQFCEPKIAFESYAHYPATRHVAAPRVCSRLGDKWPGEAKCWAFLDSWIFSGIEGVCHSLDWVQTAKVCCNWGQDSALL